MVHHRVITEQPPNIGVTVAGLTGVSLSQQQMYVRCNFPLPRVVPDGFHLVMPGKKSRFVTREHLRAHEQVTRDMVLECAGNGRSLMTPVPGGTRWDLDGVSAITVGGCRLDGVLGPIPEEITEFVFTGADVGLVAEGKRVPYQFSISRELAESSTPILATHIGGEPLDKVHGGPIRLIVPGHYAMKSVKWLTRIEGVTGPFRGHFVEKYRYYSDTSEPEQAPVDEINVRSVISSPLHGESVRAGAVEIRGSAWSGRSEVDEVEVSVDGGETWHQADLVRRPTRGPWAPVQWVHTTDVMSGRLQIMSRATDEHGATQPLEARWNANGYGNNVVHRVTVEVVEP